MMSISYRSQFVLLLKETLILFLLSACAFVSFARSVDAADRGRVIIQNGTVYTDIGTMIRGSTMAVMYGVGNSNNPTYWDYMNKTLRLNAVRFGVKTGQIGRTVQQQIPYIDYAVNQASSHNMYLMINNSIQPGGYDLDQLKAFWSVVAPRYANRTHVFFEVTNEPVQGPPVWGNAPQFTDKVLSDLKSLYDIIRQGAPDSHIVMLTAPNLYPDCTTYAAMIAKLQGIDWTKTSVGFHHYQGTERFGEANLRCLRDKYPLLLTETNYWMNSSVSNLRYALDLYEKLQMSWFSLDGRGSAPHLQYEILPQLAQEGYYWSAAN